MEHFQSSHGLRTFGGSVRTAVPIPVSGSSERKYDREYDDECAGTDHSNYLPVVVVLAIILSL